MKTEKNKPQPNPYQSIGIEYLVPARYKGFAWEKILNYMIVEFYLFVHLVQEKNRGKTHNSSISRVLIFITNVNNEVVRWAD